MSALTTGSGAVAEVMPSATEMAVQPRKHFFARMRRTLSMAISPVIEARGGLISPPVRRMERAGCSPIRRALPLLVTTVTSRASMKSMMERAVELPLMKMQSPSQTYFAASRAMARLALTRWDPDGRPSGLRREALPCWRDRTWRLSSQSRSRLIVSCDTSKCSASSATLACPSRSRRAMMASRLAATNALLLRMGSALLL